MYLLIGVRKDMWVVKIYFMVGAGLDMVTSLV